MKGRVPVSVKLDDATRQNLEALIKATGKDADEVVGNAIDWFYEQRKNAVPRRASKKLPKVGSK